MDTKPTARRRRQHARRVRSPNPTALIRLKQGVEGRLGISTALAVFPRGKTAEAVLERATVTNTQLKQGVNEVRTKGACFFERRPRSAQK